MGVTKKLLYLNRKAPHGSIYAQEALEVVLIGSAFDQEISLAFVDDGVFQLKKQQDTKATGMKNFSPTYRALDDYDVNQLYVEQESLSARGLSVEDLIVPVQVLSSAELAALMATQDVVFSF